MKLSRYFGVLTFDSSSGWQMAAAQLETGECNCHDCRETRNTDHGRAAQPRHLSGLRRRANARSQEGLFGTTNSEAVDAQQLTGKGGTIHIARAGVESDSDPTTISAG